VDFDYHIAIPRNRRAAANCRLTESRPSWDNPTPSLNYECGRLTREEFYEQARKATGFRGTMEEFSENCFRGLFTAIPPMIEIHAGLRRRGIPTYIFSNTNDLADSTSGGISRSSVILTATFIPTKSAQ